MNPNVDILIAAYLTGSAKADEVARLEKILHNEPGARRRFAELCEQDVALADVLQVEHRARTAERPRPVSTVRPPPTPSRRVSQRRRKKRASAATWRPLAMAAAVLLALGLGWWLGTDDDDGGHDPVTTPQPTVVLGTGRAAGVSLAKGATVPRDTWITADDHGLHLHLATRRALAILDPASRARIDAGGGLRIERGRVACSVMPQERGERFAVTTPHGRIEVIGTRFRIEVDDDASTVEVLEGTVDVHDQHRHHRRLGDGERTRLDAAGFTPPPPVRDEPALEEAVTLTLVAAGAGQVIPEGAPLRDGAVLNADILPENGVNILVTGPPTLRAIKAWHDGERSFRALENEYPYYIFGNRTGDPDGVYSRTLAPGTHELRLCCFTDSNGTEPLGPDLIIRFTIEP